MGFSYQLNALTEDELAKAAKEEIGETSNLMEVASPQSLSQTSKIVYMT